MRDYDYNLQEFNISKWRQRELVAYFRQYPELKRKLKHISLIASPDLSDNPHSTSPSNPTERIAYKRAYITQKIDIIDTALDQIDKLYRSSVKSNLCYGKSMQKVRGGTRYFSQKLFYQERRKALYYLHLELTQMTED